MVNATLERRAGQRESLISCAQEAIAADGVGTLRARQLAACVGCSVGALYNLVVDMDELVLLVAQRTMTALAARLDAIKEIDATERLVEWAKVYAAFAAENRNLWRALFEFRLSPGRELPEWFAQEQMLLFGRLETALTGFLPHASKAVLQMRARILFSAVHGVVALALEEKLVALPAVALQTELEAFVRTYIEGMRRETAGRSKS